MSFGSGGGTNGNDSAFETFLEGWMVRQEHYLDELLSAQQNCHESRDDDLKELVARVLSHYQQYYEEKLRVVQGNVFLVFSPTWFTSFECTFLWIAGFKPGLAFRLVNNSVDDLSEDQTRRMNRLIEETKAEERILADQWARIQESIAATPMLALARRVVRLVNSEVEVSEEAMESVRSSMESVVANADLLRMNTAAKVVDILSPAQNVRFLAATTQLQLRIRSWGLQRAAERQATNGW